MKVKFHRPQSRHSIRFKLTFTLTSIIIITIFALWFLNRTFLENYYLHSKVDTLGNTFEEIRKVLTDNSDDASITDEQTLKIDRLSDKRGVNIYIITSQMELIVSSGRSNDPDWDISLKKILQEYIFKTQITDDKSKTSLAETSNYSIFKSYDDRLQSNYVNLIGYFDGNFVILRTNMESMRESIKIANQFLALVGVVSVLIATGIMFYISKKFTTPILDLAGIAKRMSDLDFDIKYNISTQDEIGLLGNSINTLSEKLENTISELKSANNELLSDIQNKIQIDEMRKDFLSNVTHELKTPIALIQGYAEGLKDNVNEDEDSREFYCDVIVDEARKMNDMVKKLLSLNQIESGNNQVNIERFDIVALIRSVLASTELFFQQKEVLLHFEETEPIYVWADEYMIEEVITNYVSNALNHVDGAKIVEIKLIRKENVVRVAVFNTGANIPDEDIDNVWIKFYKVDKARTREYGGSGIGLSIVKAIMTSHNQECGVLNHETGVEFWFELDTKAE